MREEEFYTVRVVENEGGMPRVYAGYSADEAAAAAAKYRKGGCRVRVTVLSKHGHRVCYDRVPGVPGTRRRWIHASRDGTIIVGDSFLGVDGNSYKVVDVVENSVRDAVLERSDGLRIRITAHNLRWNADGTLEWKWEELQNG